MAKYQKYAEYKDSGIEALGFIPKDWEVLRGKFLFHEINERSENGDELLLSVSEYYGVKPRAEKIEQGDFLSRAESLEGYKKCYPNDLVMNIMLAWKRGLGISKYAGIVSPAYSVFRFNEKVNPDYIHYLLRTDDYIKYFKTRSTGIIDSRLRLYPESFGDIGILLPDLEDQLKIASFLDHETSKIDSLIAKQEKLIELLKEKRQAVISHAVTKGLNPDVPMKDSGVEWLGQVPEHWTVTRAKFVSDIFVPQRNKPELNDMEGYSWVTMDDMKNKYIQSVNRYVTKNSAMLAGSKILKKGAVIASCVGNFGITSINNIDVIINQQLQAFIPRNIKAEYLQNLVSISKKYFELIGTAATLVYVNQEGFQNLPVLLPPYDEQVAICVQIENDENKYDQLIHLGLKQIKILQERRTALISSAVTGKIDVRNWQHPNEAKTGLSA